MITGKTFKNNFTYCNGIRGLFNALEITYQPKAVLLHFGNIMPLVLVAHNLLVCADLKLIVLFNGLKTKYSKFMCFL